MKLCLNTVLLSVAVLLADIWAAEVWAADRALLIGVGTYADANHNLDGIDLDLDIMTRVARNIGFDESAIKILSDEQATVAAVDEAMSHWLVDSVKPQDRVLLYFSGHGTQLKDINGDEADGVDEALAMHDLEFIDGGLSGVLLDDRFYELLSNIPSDNIFLIVDACHSGTGYRAIDEIFTGDNTAQVKSFRYAGIPTGVEGGFTDAPKSRAVSDVTSPEHFAALMAAADDEQSLATRSGSLFTLALAEGIDNALRDKNSVTLRQLQQHTSSMIKAALEQSAPERIFTPQLDGNKRLVDMPLLVSTVANRRQQLMQIADEYPGVQLSANKQSFVLGDLSLRLTVQVPKKGYLNIVAVNADDQAVVLYPNAFNPVNDLQPGELSLPTTQMTFDFRAARPVGDTAVFAFLSDTPVNLYQSGLGEQTETGEFKRGLLTKLSARGERSIKAVASEASLLAGSVTISVVEQ